MSTFPSHSLSEAELDELEAFLLSDEMPESGMDISTLDGFLAAVLLNPDRIMPSQWLPWVWDMESAADSPAFADLAQAQRISGFVLRHYNAVAHSLDEGRFEPLFYQLEQADDSELFDAEGWAEGFMLGVKAFLDPWWAPVLKDQVALVAPMVLLGTENGRKSLAGSGDGKAATKAAYEAIPAAVAALREHFRPLREQAGRPRTAPVPRAAAKVGRNDPCPCGSGKKYKKCCGGPSAPD